MELRGKLSNFDLKNLLNASTKYIYIYICQSLTVCHEAPFDWKFLQIGPITVFLKSPSYKIVGSPFAPPTALNIKRVYVVLY